MSQPTKLAILVSKQCDAIIGRGTADRFIHQCYDKVEAALVNGDWSAIRTNSITLAAAFGLEHYPPAEQYEATELAEKYIERCTHVLAFWGGGNRFLESLRLALKLDRGVRAYKCDLVLHRVKHVPNSALAESDW